MRRLSTIVFAGTLFMGATVQASEGLVLRIRQAGDKRRGFGCYVNGARIPIQLEITNESDEAASVRLVEHDRDGHREPFPAGLQMRVVDGKGLVLTTHDLNLGEEQREWWTSQYLSSTASLSTEVDMPGSRIELKPEDSVRRVYDIRHLAGGCRSCPLPLSEFPPGNYFLELRLDGLRSNQYEIIVRNADEECD